VQNLSKKEKKVLKEKELNELDSILAEMGIQPGTAQSASASASAPTAVATVNEPSSQILVQTQTTNEEGKKKVKKKVKKNCLTTEPASVSETVVPQKIDVQEVLKNKLKSKKLNSESISKLAVAEALKESRSVDVKKKSGKKNYGDNY
jgi:hypothetical protein